MSAPDEPYDLAKLYRHGARERPSEEIDRAILELAKGSLDQSVTEKQDVSHEMLFTWSRITSVAAVMVLSIYLFFDMRHEVQYDPLLNESYDQQLDDAAGLSVPSVSSEQMSSEEVSNESVSNKPEPEERKQLSPQLMERASTQLEQGQSAMFEQNKAEVKLKAKKEMQATQKNAVPKRTFERQGFDVQAKPSLAPSPSAEISVFEADELAQGGAIQTEAVAPNEKAALIDSRLDELQKIRELLAEGKREEALQLLEEFNKQNPGYLLPKDLLLERVQNTLKD
mgnify:CR=1 FL=1